MCFQQPAPKVGALSEASAPQQLLLRCSTSCGHAVVLTPLAYFHVGNDCLLHLPALTYHNRQVFKLLTIV